MNRKLSFTKLCLCGLAAAIILCLSSSESRAAMPDVHVRAVALYAMGVIYDLQEMTDEAIDSYQSSLKLEASTAAHLRLGSDFARIGKISESEKELNIVLTRDPENVQAHYLLALLYTSEKDFDKAAQEYEKILTSFSQIDPKNVEIYGYLAQLYYYQKKYDKAIKQFEIILSLNPAESADLVYLVGTLYLEVNNKERAVEMFDRALKIDPNHDGSLNSLGYIYAEDGEKLDEAQSMIEKAISIDPENGAYLDSLGWVYFKKGEYEQALQYLNKADSYLKDPVIYEHLGDVYFRMGQKDNAKKYWSSSLQLLPDQDSVLQKIKSLGSL